MTQIETQANNNPSVASDLQRDANEYLIRGGSFQPAPTDNLLSRIGNKEAERMSGTLLRVGWNEFTRIVYDSVRPTVEVYQSPRTPTQ